MQKIFMPEVSQAERLRIMADTCDRTEETTYYKQLDQTEMDIRREQLADNSIKHFKLGEELKEIKSDFKERMEPLARDNQQIMHELDTGQAEVKGRLFYLANHDDNMMEVYNEDGEMISSRRLLPNEKQQRLPFIKPAANDE